MNKEIISDKQGIILIILFVWGSALVLGTAGAALKDVWLAKILGILMALPVLMIYAKLLSMFEGKDIFDILNLAFGKIIGRIISLIYIWYALHIGALVLYTFSEFVSTIGLNETPKIVFMGMLMFLSTWAVKEGIEVLGRWAEILIVFLVFMISMNFILSIPNMKINNLLPILENGVKPVIKGGFSAFSFPFAETVIFTMVFSCLKDKKSIFKTYISGLLLSGTVLVFIAARNIMVLGSYVMSTTYYSTYNAVEKINIGYFLQRLESAVSIVFLIAGFVQISISLLGASKGISKIFNFNDYRFIVTPTALIIMNLAFLAADDMMELTEWNLKVYPYYGFIFEVILPLLTFFICKIRYKKIITNINNG